MIIRSLLSAVCLSVLVFAATSAHAQAVPGCNPQVLDGMQKKAQAKVAADVAMTESIVDKPDSVLAMTCINNAAGTSAQHGGSIFSGDFTTGLQPVIEEALRAFFDDFQDGAGFEAMIAGLATAVDYTQTAIPATAPQDCNETQNLWSTIKQQGIRQGVPFATLANLISGAFPTGLIAGDEYNDNWQQNITDGIFSDLAAAITALPVPATTPYTTNQTACQVLQALGSIPAGPCP